MKRLFAPFLSSSLLEEHHIVFFFAGWSAFRRASDAAKVEK